MAKIVLGLATAHGPLLSTPPDQWGQRAAADQSNTSLFFQGTYHTYKELLERRQSEGLERHLEQQVMTERHAANQQGISALAKAFLEAQPDVVVIIGNDQNELMDDTNLPAFLVFWGSEFTNGPLSEEKVDQRGPGLAVADWAYYPDEKRRYPGHPQLGKHVLQALTGKGFDVAQSQRFSSSNDSSGIPHAFAFVHRRIMEDLVVPTVPVFINTFYAPNQPSLARCFDFGQALGEVIASWTGDADVAIIGSGGLSHYVIEEELDREVLQTLETKEAQAIRALPDNRFESGTSEIRTWVALAGAMSTTPLNLDVIDYVPCYRTPAGTGQGMGFAQWR